VLYCLYTFLLIILFINNVYAISYVNQTVSVLTCYCLHIVLFIGNVYAVLHMSIK